MPRRNLATLLDDLAREPERPAFALRTPYRRFAWTAVETRRAALAFGDRLRRRGLSPGEPVLLQGPNTPEWVAAFLGIAAAGCVAVPLDEGATPEFLGKVAEKVGARRAVVASRTLALTGEGVTVEPLESLRDLRGDRWPLPPPHEAKPDDTAEIVFTSGTTSEPKGVELSHSNLLVSLAGIEKGFRKREWYLSRFLPFRLLCLVPLSHLLGQTAGIFLPVIMRSTSVFSSTLQPARLLAAIRRERPLAVVTVPRTLASLSEAAMRELERQGRLARFHEALRRAQGRPAWRRVLVTRDIRRVLGWRTWLLVVGGARLEPEVERFWTGCGFAVVQGYGMTEAAPLITIHNPLDGLTGTIGRRVGENEIRIATDGEILVRGPNVMKGYYGDPRATREALEGGWLHTGDLAEMDAEGRLYYKGRKKDLIVTPEGMNVFPSDVERVLRGLPGVREAVVFPLAGSRGEEIHAAVLLAQPGAETEAIRSEANARLLPHQRLRDVALWEGHDFPRTRTGKVRRGEVAATIGASRSAGSVGPVGPQALVSASPVSPVARALARLRPEVSATQLAAGTRLAEDLGLSSLEVVELVGLLEEESDVAIDDRQLLGSVSVGDLERLASQPVASRTAVDTPAAAAAGPPGGESPDASRLRMPRWGRAAPARWIRAILREALLRPLFRMFVTLEVRGAERLEGLPRDDPLLFVANHSSLLDSPAVLFSLPRRLRRRLAPAMAIETIHSVFLYVLAVFLFNSYPMPQSRGYRPSLEYTGELMDAGFSPLVFPEGHMTLTGRMASFKQGIGLLAIETRALVVPVLLEGLGTIMPPTSWWPGRGRARVTVGEAFVPRGVSPGSPEGDRAARVAAEIEQAVRALGSLGTADRSALL